MRAHTGMMLGLAISAVMLGGCSSGDGSAGAGHTSSPMSPSCAQRTNTVAGVTWVHDIVIDAGPVDCLNASNVLDSLQTTPADWGPTGNGAVQKDVWTCIGTTPDRQQLGVVDWTCTAGDGSKFRSLLMHKSTPSQEAAPPQAAPPPAPPPGSPAALPPPPPPAGAAAPAPGSPGADYFVDGGYFFTSPSGKWRCGIVPGKGLAGCMSGTDDGTFPITGVPQGSNSILVDGTGARVANVSPAPFRPSGGSAPKVLDYGQTLTAQGFTFTIAESGITCHHDSDGHGFTFSTDGYQFS